MLKEKSPYLLPKEPRVENQELLQRARDGVCLINNSECGGPTDPEHLSTRGAWHGDTEDNVYSICRVHHVEKGKIGVGKMVQKYRPFYLMLVEKDRQDVIEKAKRFFPIIPWEGEGGVSH